MKIHISFSSWSYLSKGACIILVVCLLWIRHSLPLKKKILINKRRKRIAYRMIISFFFLVHGCFWGIFSLCIYFPVFPFKAFSPISKVRHITLVFSLPVTFFRSHWNEAKTVFFFYSFPLLGKVNTKLIITFMCFFYLLS